MNLTMWIRVMAGIVLLTTFVAIEVAWRAQISDRATLAAELAATKTALEAAAARQQERDAKLADTLAAIAKQKRAVQSPAQIVKDLPLQMHLPAPIVLQDAPVASGSLLGESSSQSPKTDGTSSDSKASNMQAVVPGEDLKPMYDFAQLQRVIWQMSRERPGR